MKDRNKYISEIFPDVQTAARTASREWADVLDTDDAEQEIWVRLLKSSQDYVIEIAAMEKAVRVSVLTEIGHQIGMKYREDYELFSGNHRYGTRQVRDMLNRDALDGVDQTTDMPLWELPETVISEISKSQTETITERIDLLLGMKRLSARNEWYGQVLVAEFRDAEPVHSHSQELTRSVDALTREMNNSFRRRSAEYSQGPGTRQSMNNHEAGRQTSREYAR